MEFYGTTNRDERVGVGMFEEYYTPKYFRYRPLNQVGGMSVIVIDRFDEGTMSTCPLIRTSFHGSIANMDNTFCTQLDSPSDLAQECRKNEKPVKSICILQAN